MTIVRNIVRSLLDFVVKVILYSGISIYMVEHPEHELQETLATVLVVLTMNTSWNSMSK